MVFFLVFADFRKFLIDFLVAQVSGETVNIRFHIFFDWTVRFVDMDAIGESAIPCHINNLGKMLLQIGFVKLIHSGDFKRGKSRSVSYESALTHR